MNSQVFFDYLSNKNCIFWDWNGTLLNDLDYSLGVNNRIFVDKGAEPLSKDYYQSVFTLPISEYYDNLKLEERGIERDELTRLFVQNYEAQRHTVSMYPGARSCLKDLSKASVTQVLFSAAHITELEFQVKHHKIQDFFDILSGAGDFHGGCKLDRGRAIRDEHNFENGVVVGDTLHDVEIGKKIGFETVWVSEGHQALARAEGRNFIDYIYNRRTGEFYKN